MRELHLIYHGCDSVRQALDLAKVEHPGYSAVFARSFNSIGQKPLDSTGKAVWLYMVHGVSVSENGNVSSVDFDGCTMRWTQGLTASGADSEAQMHSIFKNFGSLDDVVRTWIFVNDIDNNYEGIVKARKEWFETHGLTDDTHYIASTGIQGECPVRGCLVNMDVLEIAGLKSGQLRYLYAPTHMNRTSEYGVTFERGVRIEFSDRVHTYISGTASIDNRGNVLHVGDAGLQARRAWENVGVLLNESGASCRDIRMAVVYLRNESDYPVVQQFCDENMDGFPYVITLAPVCRPAWLFEMECIAVSAKTR